MYRKQLILFVRPYCTKSPRIIGVASKPDPETIKEDYIGPPHPKSNIRLIIRHIPENESKLQTKFRLKRMDVQEWNQQFWSNHNERFYTEKEEFVKQNKQNESDTITSDKMSEFYKDFLDRNWRLHLLYNVSWYLKNFTLLFLAIKVNIEKVYLKIKRPKRS